MGFRGVPIFLATKGRRYRRHLVVPLLSSPVAYHQFLALEDDMGRMCENIEKVVMKTCKNIVKVVAKTC